MSQPVRFPAQLEGFFRAVAAVLSQEGRAGEAAVLRHAKATVSVVDFDAHGTGRTTWRIVLALDPAEALSAKYRWSEGLIQRAADKVIGQFGLHAVDRVEVVPQVVPVQEWREGTTPSPTGGHPLTSLLGMSPNTDSDLHQAGAVRPESPLAGLFDIFPDTEPKAPEKMPRDRQPSPNPGAPVMSGNSTESKSALSRIFLSHKGVDKPTVRKYHETLKLLGFDPWLDEDAMTAGTNLQRGILKGMKESCAVVFFVTPNYVDDKFLATEIDYATDEKLHRGDAFAIVTLVFEHAGQKGKVPDLLRRYVWKEPADDLEGLRVILRALPVKVGHVG